MATAGEGAAPPLGAGRRSGRGRGRRRGRRGSVLLRGLEDDELDAPVLLASGAGLVVGDRLVGTVTLRLQAVGRDPLLAEVLRDGLGARLRQLLVLIGGADVVGVAGDLDGEDLLPRL